MKASRGQFISFEGVDGVGKTTQIAFLADFLRLGGGEVVLVREPGGTELGEEIRRILKFADYGNAISQETEALLFASARAQLVREVIIPALERGATVISDRFTDSSVAYQGAGRGLGAEAVSAINRFATGGIEPDWTILLDLAPEAGFARARSREPENNGGKTDRMESLEADFYERVRACYKELAVAFPGRISVVDADAPAGEIAAKIREKFLQRFPFAGKKSEGGAR